MSKTYAPEASHTQPASPTGTPKLPTQWVPLLGLLVIVAIAVKRVSTFHPLMQDIASVVVEVGGLLGLYSAGWRGPGVKALAALLVLGCVGLTSPAMAQEGPADAPRAVQLLPVPVPAYAPTRAECFRWDRSRRNWTAVGVVSGALATTGGLVSALGSVGEDRSARVAVAVSSAVLAAVGALAAYESGEYASIHRERCTTLAL